MTTIEGTGGLVLTDIHSLLGQPVRQLGYFVSDVEEAARQHSVLFGSGPFFIHHGMQPGCTHWGQHHPISMSIAIGQWGGQMVEFVQQDTPGPSIFHDIYPEGSGRYGFHHIAVIVDDLAAATAAMEAAGYPVAARFRPDEGYDVVFADATATLGHMIELYAAVPEVLGIYDFVASAAEGYDGTDSLRPLVMALPAA